ncbi:hypothetical protein PENSPDRAFT_654205 [Peniophora sp. CONT]|nr:hypothetical protein PENSPDRAFT_654205 [Peniophora sp. CONT]
MHPCVAEILDIESHAGLPTGLGIYYRAFVGGDSRSWSGSGSSGTRELGKEIDHLNYTCTFAVLASWLYLSRAFYVRICRAATLYPFSACMHESCACRCLLWPLRRSHPTRSRTCWASNHLFGEQLVGAGASSLVGHAEWKTPAATPSHPRFTRPWSAPMYILYTTKRPSVGKRADIISSEGRRFLSCQMGKAQGARQ